MAVVTAQIELDIMTYLRWIVFITLGLLSAGISTANDCEEGARSASGPTIGLNAAGPPVTVDVACHFTSATSDLTFTVVSTDSLTVTASLNGTLLTLDPGHVRNRTPDTATVTVRRGIESYVINVAVSSCVKAGAGLLPRRIVKPGQVMTWDFSMSDYFVKTGGGTPTYEASSSNRDTVDVSLSGSQLTLTGGSLPNGKDRVQAELILMARNDCGAARVQIPVTVSSNEPPEVRSPLGATTLASHGYMTSYSLSDHFRDPDGNPLTYSVEASDPATVGGSFYYSSLTVTTGPVTATTKDSLFVTATDSGRLSATDTLVVTVTPNVAPSRDNDIPDTELAAGGATEEYALSDYFSDPDGTSADLRYEASSSEPDTVTAAIAGGVLTVTTKDVDAPGESTITVTATDPGNLDVSDDFVVTVTCQITVHPPIPDVSLGSGGSTHQVTLANHFSGSSCGEFSYEDPTSSASGVATAAIADGVLTVTSGSTTGTATITVEATGSGDFSASTTFDVTVTSGCTIDVTTIPDVSLAPGGTTHEVTLANHFSGSNCGELDYESTSSLRAWRRPQLQPAC